VLALRAIFAGFEGPLTSYIDRSGADVIVAQQGVRSMHMTESALPLGDVRAISHVPGVAHAEGILYRTAFVERGRSSGAVALVGGGPVPGDVARPQTGEIVLDLALAEQLNVSVGDRVQVIGMPLRVSGEISGTASLASSYAFVARATLARALHAEQLTSYVLVRARPGVSAEALARRIEREVPSVTASTTPQFADSERRLVGDMATDIVRAMMLTGLIIGIAVAGLVAYSQTLGQLRDCGVLRAIGLSARRALTLVAAQIAVLVGSGLVVSLVLVELLAAVGPRLSTGLALDVRPEDVLQTAALATAVTVGAALVPILRVARVEPASVFRRSS
jgi:putative ABC transport system permease protein